MQDLLRSNGSVQCTLDLGPDFVTLTVNDLVHEMTINSQATQFAAWNLLLHQRQDFCAIIWLESQLLHPATMEIRHEVISSVGAQEVDIRVYQVSDLEDRVSLRRS